MRVRYKITLLIMLGLLGMLVSAAPVMGQDVFTPTETCPAFIDQALSQIGNNCANLGGSNACYGFGTVTADLDEGATVPFSQPTDRVSLDVLNGLRTAGYDATSGEFGIALLNVLAQPAPSEGFVAEDVKYILFGDVEITNAVAGDNMFLLPEVAPSLTTAVEGILRLSPSSSGTEAAVLPAGTILLADGITRDNQWVHVIAGEYTGWINSDAFGDGANFNALPKVKSSGLYPMQAFDFNTVQTTVEGCEGVPSALLILQAPPDTMVDIIANGVPVRFNNTIFLRTLPDSGIEIINVSGEVTVNPGSSTQTTFRAAGSVLARPAANGTTVSYRILGRFELENFLAIEGLPENVLYSPISLPAVLQPSPSDGTDIIIIDDDEPVTPTDDEPEFPRPPLDVGIPGDPLPGFVWDTPIVIGGEACPSFVVYHGDGGGSWSIYRTNGGLSNPPINISGSTTEGSGSIQPSRSQDAEWVAFTTNRDDGNWEIYVGRSDGTEVRRITFNTGVDINPVWGYGNVILFESNRDANWEIYAFDVSTGTETRLTNFPDGADVDASWSQTQPVFVFSREVGSDYELFLYNYETGEETQLTDNGVDDVSAAFSNDGTKIAWVQRNNVGIFNLIVRDLVTGEEETLVDIGTDVTLPTWSLDDQWIAFETSEGGDFEIFAVELESGAIKNVSNNTFQDRAPSINCATGNIIYQSDAVDINRNFDLFEINPLPLEPTGPFNAAIPVTNLPTNEIYGMNSPLDENGSREGRLP